MDFWTRAGNIIAGKTLYTSRAFILLSLANDVSVATVDERDSFEFSSKVDFTSPLYVYITLATDTDAAAMRLAQLLGTAIPKMFWHS